MARTAEAQAAAVATPAVQAAPVETPEPAAAAVTAGLVVPAALAARASRSSAAGSARISPGTTATAAHAATPALAVRRARPVSASLAPRASGTAVPPASTSRATRPTAAAATSSATPVRPATPWRAPPGATATERQLDTPGVVIPTRPSGSQPDDRALRSAQPDELAKRQQPGSQHLSGSPLTEKEVMKMKNWRVVGRENKKIEFDRVRPIPERTRHGPHGPPPRGGTTGSARLTTTGPASYYNAHLPTQTFS